MLGSFTSNSKWLLATKLVCKQGEDVCPNSRQMDTTEIVLSGISRVCKVIPVDKASFSVRRTSSSFTRIPLLPNSR